MCKESNPRLLQLKLQRARENGQRRPSVARRQNFAERRNFWRDDAFDPRVVGVVKGSDGCAHAGVDIRELTRV